MPGLPRHPLSQLEKGLSELLGEIEVVRREIRSAKEPHMELADGTAHRHAHGGGGGGGGRLDGGREEATDARRRPHSKLSAPHTAGLAS